jgi:methylglyoxal synthase
MTERKKSRIISGVNERKTFLTRHDIYSTGKQNEIYDY